MDDWQIRPDDEREPLDPDVREFLAVQAWEFRQKIDQLDGTSYEAYILEGIAYNIEEAGDLPEQIEAEPFIMDEDEEEDEE